MTHVLSDRAVVVVALCSVGGAWLARPVWWPLLVVLAAASVLRPRAVVVGVAVGVLASGAGARAWQGVRDAPTRGSVRDVGATVVRDPEWRFGSLRTELRLDDGRRVAANASAEAAGVLAPLLAGERVVIDGRLRPVSASSRAFLARRHIGSAVVVAAARDPGPGGPVARFTNELRRTLVRGASSIPAERRALFTGLVLGDDREQEPAEVDDFRAAGLTHLLAVSGQNVAFVLAVAAPLLRLLSLRARLVIGVAVLVVFGVLTRWEPSVLRAVAMAAGSLSAATLGRPASSLRVLALAVVGLVLVDPLLAGSVGFLLSVSACVGIAVIAPRLERRGVPAPLAVTLAAQAGVAPVLVPVFGGMPLASVPANLLAVPAAGPVMVWGLVAGLPAGIVGGPIAMALHLPTRVLLAWISGVAAAAASLPLPVLGPGATLAMAAAVGAAVLTIRRRPQLVAACSALALVVGLVVDARQVRPLEGVELALGARAWRSDSGATVAVLGGNADVGSVLAGLRRHRIRRIDVLVLRSGGSNAARLSAAVRHRSAVGLTVAPEGHRVPGARAAGARRQVEVGDLRVETEAIGGRLEVRVASPRAPRARPPPVRRHLARARHGHPQPHHGLVLRQGRVLRPR